RFLGLGVFHSAFGGFHGGFGGLRSFGGLHNGFGGLRGFGGAGFRGILLLIPTIGRVGSQTFNVFQGNTAEAYGLFSSSKRVPNDKPSAKRHLSGLTKGGSEWDRAPPRSSSLSAAEQASTLVRRRMICAFVQPGCSKVSFRAVVPR